MKLTVSTSVGDFSTNLRLRLGTGVEVSPGGGRVTGARPGTEDAPGLGGGKAI